MLRLIAQDQFEFQNILQSRKLTFFIDSCPNIILLTASTNSNCTTHRTSNVVKSASLLLQNFSCSKSGNLKNFVIRDEWFAMVKKYFN